VDDVTVTFGVFSSPLGLIHLALGFSVSVKGCYVTSLHQDMFLCSLPTTSGGVLNAVLCLGCTDNKGLLFSKVVSSAEKYALMKVQYDSEIAVV
jgi:hypothetical protein